MAIRRTTKIGLVLSALALALVTACSTSAPTTQSTTGSANADTAALEKLYQGTEGEPPSSSPPVAKGASVWWVSCGLSIQDCSGPAEAAQEAAEKLGLDFHIADGKLNVGGGMAAAVRTALAAKPDAIILHGIPCPAVQQPLEEARIQGVKVLGVESLDCSDTGGPKLFTADMQYTTNAPTGVDYFRTWGELSADYLIAATGGQAKIINNAGVEPLQDAVNQGFLDRLASCPGCEIIDTVNFGSAEVVPNGPWIQSFRSALVRNPDATAVFLPFDSLISGAGGAKAIKESGLKVISFGGSGGAGAMQLVRDGSFTAVTGAHSPDWMGYAAVDQINRALNGQPAVPQGVGMRIVDAQHNLPRDPNTYYQTPIDFRAAYAKAWSAAGS